MATLKIRLGSKILEITPKTDSQEAMIKVMAFWSQLPDKCGLCKSQNIGLNYKNPKKDGKEYDYYGLKCLDCKAELWFHQKMDKSGFYLTEKDQWELYVPPAQIEAPPAHTPLEAPPEDDAGDTDIPF